VASRSDAVSGGREPVGLAGFLGRAVSDRAAAISVVAIGALIWLLGHGHHALRHGV
jgi:hypothetical protein